MTFRELNREALRKVGISEVKILEFEKYADEGCGRIPWFDTSSVDQEVTEEKAKELLPVLIRFYRATLEVADQEWNDIRQELKNQIFRNN